METYKDESVFSLITKLCEKFQTDPQRLKESRKKSFEILLGKRISKYKKGFADLKGSPDPICDLLSWQFRLTHEYDLRDHADDLKKCVTDIETIKNNVEYFNNILQFLLHLKKLPTKDKNKLDISSLPPLTEFENFTNLFKLPAELLKESTLFDGSHALEESRIPRIPSESSHNSKELFEDLFRDEGYFSPPSKSPTNIWELASTLKYSKRKNWENFGMPEPEKEKPFLSELGDLSSLWVENLESLYLVRIFKDGIVYNSKLVPRKIFIGDLKYLLVGIASESFGFNANGEFYLIPGVCVEGITPSTLKIYCNNMMFCGTCFKGLDRICTPSLDTGKYKYEGIIFKEFCESVSRYLKFYRTAIFTIPDNSNYLEFDEKTHDLQSQISILASICKVGPYTESEEIPHGVALLNYLYQKVLGVTEKKVTSVLYSILYPCCQVYFRFKRK